MGAVYEAVHVRLERRFAIKTLHPEQEAPDALRRFEREARIVASLESQHIVPVVDFDHTPDGVAYLVMDYVDGQDLRRLLSREGALSLRRAVNLLSQAGRGIAAAHDRGIIHRDLKPSNLLVSTDRGGRELCQVADFGVAREGDDWRTKDSVATKTGALIGTLGYMAPEQIRGEKLDFRTDVYALGAIAYECLTDQRAFSADAPHTLMYRILHERPQPLAKIRPDLPSDVSALVERAMASKPEERFEHVDQFVDALEATLGTQRAAAQDVTLADGDASNSLAGVPLPVRRRGMELSIAALVAAGFGSLLTAAALQQTAPDAIASAERVEPALPTVSFAAPGPAPSERPSAAPPAVAPPARVAEASANPAALRPPARVRPRAAAAAAALSAPASSLNRDGVVDPFSNAAPGSHGLWCGGLRYRHCARSRV
jgi:tRNA A-37 threonylcarbamoyl transferase component Bud32